MRIAAVVLGDRFGEGMRVVRSRTLSQVADAGVGDLLEHLHAFLRTRLVVEMHHFQFRAAQHAALRIDLVDNGIEVPGETLPGQRERPAQRVDVGDLGGFRGLGREDRKRLWWGQGVDLGGRGCL